MKISYRIGALGLALALSGCATGSNPQDPLESYNRAMFGFNDKLDMVVVKPAATVYQDLLPSFVQTGIGNFFGNIGDVWTAVNNLLQGNLENGMTDIMRVALNSTMGFLGVLDIGSEAGLTKHREDFGQTLGVWGMQSGPYVVLPVFGSSTARDTAAFPVDFSADLWSYKDPVYVRNIGTGVRLIDRRAVLLGASSMIEDAALDKYAFTRDAYLQRRESLIRNGSSSKADYDE
ncbi:MAG: VacJ family lipoprotein [Oxalobacteraceae bacterium]